MMVWTVFSRPRSWAAADCTTDDDVTLIDRFLRADDEDSFDILVRRYREKVFRLAASILGRGAQTEAEDATQEVFIVVFRQLKTFRRDSKFSTWLYGVARNQIIDYQRRSSRRRSGVSADVLESIPDEGARANPQKMVSAAQTRDRLLHHVDRLSEIQRLVVHLYYWQEQSVSEISELLGLGSNTIKSHLRRARRRLAIALQETAPRA
jgi:RNA polymerase sigma-70 factor (ECF subfamily)